jgi:hypothetical protein
MPKNALITKAIVTTIKDIAATTHQAIILSIISTKPLKKTLLSILYPLISSNFLSFT